ncbi:hypothetical protein L873DRAFT_1443874 [Choiromyces venosus 120613-1]|uniref:Uncharacterized protein n=1 Tax=Choiromyces venosus 120613-1 TaxID=1336337 RepID=A0A3N4J7N3_9PEZI|nr:hypothetical protein L873DRAFT_1443874 [Choiromyces venosus 120613-1]
MPTLSLILVSSNVNSLMSSKLLPILTLFWIFWAFCRCFRSLKISCYLGFSKAIFHRIQYRFRFQ